MTTCRGRFTGKTLEERIFPRITYDGNGCWNFPTNKGSQGYGIVSAWGKDRKVHRVVWILLRGPLDDGAHIHHKCENRACCNPDHLQPTDQLVHNSHLHPSNVAFKHRVKTHCKNGHLLAGDNIDIAPHHGRERLTRVCILCRRAAAKRWFERNRDKKLAENREWYHAQGKAQRAARKSA